uniref:Cesa7 n=1 Tax=Arundo donax TaxID=35708 RepID=A0A0A9A5Y7_ARUDO
MSSSSSAATAIPGQSRCGSRTGRCARFAATTSAWLRAGSPSWRATSAPSPSAATATRTSAARARRTAPSARPATSASRVARVCPGMRKRTASTTWRTSSTGRTAMAPSALLSPCSTAT